MSPFLVTFPNLAALPTFLENLRELGETGVAEEGRVAQQFVADVRLRSVHWFGGVADVLRRMEDSERQPRQEITRR